MERWKRRCWICIVPTQIHCSYIHRFHFLRCQIDPFHVAPSRIHNSLTDHSHIRRSQINCFHIHCSQILIPSPTVPRFAVPKSTIPSSRMFDDGMVDLGTVATGTEWCSAWSRRDQSDLNNRRSTSEIVKRAVPIGPCHLSKTTLSLSNPQASGSATRSRRAPANRLLTLRVF